MLEHVFVDVVELFIVSFSVTKIIKQRRKSGWVLRTEMLVRSPHIILKCSVIATLLLAV